VRSSVFFFFFTGPHPPYELGDYIEGLGQAGRLLPACRGGLGRMYALETMQGRSRGAAAAISAQCIWVLVWCSGCS
jgi:hypothetical protein